MRKFLKKNGFNLIMLIIFLVGTAVVSYPAISDWYNSRLQSRVVSNYKDIVSTSQNLEQLKAAARAYNEQLYNGGANIAANESASDVYNDILNIAGDGVIGYIDIPIINQELPIYHGTEADVLQVAVGHAENSSFPIGGENTHALLLGHRGLPTARLFNDLDQLVKGDYFEIHVLDEVLVYEVYQIEIVEPVELDKLHIEDGEDLVTLITCTPYGINTHRLLIHGRRIDAERQKEIIYADARKINPAYAAITIGIILWAMTMVLILYYATRYRGRSLSRQERIRRNEIMDKYR